MHRKRALRRGIGALQKFDPVEAAIHRCLPHPVPVLVYNEQGSGRLGLPE